MGDHIVERRADDRDVDLALPELAGVRDPGESRKGLEPDIGRELDLGKDLEVAVPAVADCEVVRDRTDPTVERTLAHADPPGRSAAAMRSNRSRSTPPVRIRRPAGRQAAS